MTGNNITIDLSKNITTTDGLYNNNIGTIYVERQDAQNTNGTLVYSTGISGTSYSDGTTSNDTQNIVVNTNSANLTLNGAGGVDKFNVEASSFTKSLTISGNLGTVPDREEAGNNYDTVRIDLSKTSGVVLDISNLLVSNPNNEGIVITSSKGQDNITLVAGANHDVVEFKTGGGANAVTEEHSFSVGAMKVGQSLTFNGVTLTAAASATAATVANAVKTVLSSGADVTITNFNVSGTFNDWKTGSWSGATVDSSGAKITITAQNPGDLPNLNFTFTGNAAVSKADVSDATTFTAGANAVTGTANATVAYTPYDFNGATGSALTTSVTISVGSSTHTVTITAASSGATYTTANLIDYLKNGTSQNATDIVFSGGKLTLPTGITLSDDSGLKFTSSASGSAIPNIKFGIGTTTAEMKPDAAATTGTVSVNFANGLLAGQSYTFAGKTVVATSDLTGAQVAQAFTGSAGSTAVEGAVVVGTWDATKIDVAATGNDKASVAASGSVLTFTNNAAGTATGKGIKLTESAAGTALTGTGADALSTSKYTGTTTDGQKAEQILADSYVTYAVTNEGGKAASGDTYTATTVTLRDGALDSITNFDVHNDKLALKKFDPDSVKQGGEFDTTTNPANTSIVLDGALTKAGVDIAGDVFVGTAGAKATATVANGIIEFSTSGGDGTTANVTLEQKMYIALESLGKDANSQDKIAGFAHGEDFYVIATGANALSTTDDLVIKLNGVSGITDITTILA